MQQYRPLQGKSNLLTADVKPTLEVGPENYQSSFLDAVSGYSPMYGGDSSLTPKGLDQVTRMHLPASVYQQVEAPKLDLSTPTSGLQGLGSGINNFLAMRNYREQRQQQKSALEMEQQRQSRIVEQQQLEQQKQVQLEQQQYEQGARYGRTPEEQHAFGIANQQSKGKFATDLAIKQAQAPIEAQAQIEGVASKLGAFSESYGEQLQKGVWTPEAQTAFQAYFGFVPKTALDAAKAMAETRQALAQAGITELNYGALPEKLTRETEQDKLTIENSKLSNQLKTLELQFAPKKFQAELDAKGLDAAQKRQAIDARTRVMEMLDKVNTEIQGGRQVTPNALNDLQTNLNALAALGGFTAPDVAGQYAKVYGKDDLTGQVNRPNPEGEVWMKPQTKTGPAPTSTKGLTPLGQGYFLDPKTGRTFKQ